ncbi:MAG: hypothetical protein U5K31_13355 [Balneolaceae bacterium]|nr:hypothetical protein [Balneolaceae bacterium]
MKLQSDITKNGRGSGKSPGAYEWWYFDAVDPERELRVVAIFYEGNPFSRRYIEAQRSGAARSEQFPAVSISVYGGGRTLYCSFTEYGPGEARFGQEGAVLQVGRHRVETVMEEGGVRCRLHLCEELPSGDALEGELEYRGPAPDPGLFAEAAGEAEHTWNLALPRAGVRGELRLRTPLHEERRLAFEGRGYHDHNTGAEPMKEAFRNWYWGRVHFEAGTLVYYVMDDRDAGGGRSREQAWLIASDGGSISERFVRVEAEDRQRTLFGLHTARRMVIAGEGAQVTVQHEQVLDSGPFYQRFASRAFLRLPGESAVQAQPGIAEYLRPERIHQRLFWPLVNMRIYYRAEGPHWVQRSPRLYRWTW